MNLNSPDRAQTKSSPTESLMASLDDRKDQFGTRLKTAGEKFKSFFSLNYDRSTQLNLTPRNEEERKVFNTTLDNDAQAFQERRADITSQLGNLEKSLRIEDQQ